MPLNNTSDGNDITRSRVYAERLFSPNIDSIAYMTSLTANEPQGFIMATWSANTAYDGIVITTLDRTKNDDIGKFLLVCPASTLTYTFPLLCFDF